MDRCSVISASVVLITIYLFGTNAESISCKDDSGNDVDWFFAYKFPDSVSYIHCLSGATKCEMSNVEGVNSTSSMFANTLQQITRSQVLGFAYNEAMPVGSSNATKAHAKGFVLVDVQSETGIWMPHSVPKFDLGTEYAYPETGTKYGQHFACFSLDQTALKELGEHLSSMNVQSFGLIHSEYLNQVNSISEKLRKVADLTSVATLRTPPASGSFKTRGNFQVTLTRKVHTDIRNQEGDLWIWTAQIMGTNLKVQSWPCSDGTRLPKILTHDGRWWVQSIQSLNWDDYSLSYPSGRDHSNWGVSDVGSTVCVGDLDRKSTHTKRGGGIACFSDQKTWEMLNSAIDQLYIDQPHGCPAPS